VLLGVASTPGSGIVIRKYESGTVRLTRTACNALSKHGSEQSGVYQTFTSFLSSHGVPKIHQLLLKEIALIFIFDAGALFYIAPLVKQSFIKCQTNC